MLFIRTMSAVAISAIAFTVLAGQDKPKAPAAAGGQPPAMSPEEQKAMQDEMQNAMPGPIHEHMKACVGGFTTKTKMTGEGMPPDESTGTAKITMSLDGRFLVTEDETTMMGMPMKSVKISGYNNGAKRFEAVWMYTMSTGMLTMIGTSNDNGKTIKWKGAYAEAGGDQTLLVTTTHVDANTFVEKIEHGEGGAGGPVMETTYTRKK